MTDVGGLDDEAYEKHVEAGEILAQAREETVERIEVGTEYLELAEFAEDRIRELGGEPAFPLNISVDHEAAHATATVDDDRTIGEDLVNVDIGVHVDGWLADSATTVDLTGEHGDLVDASRDAVEAAIDAVEPGVDTGDVGAVIETAITDRGFNPVVNLTGHGLGHWEQHADPSIPNRAVSQGTMLEAGDVVAIEPFATDGTGKVREGSHEEIFALERESSVRNRDARQALEQITEEFQTLPFATRWLDDVRRPEMALRRLKAQNVVHGYPVLQEEAGTFVSQAEHTLIVTEDGCEVTTRAE